MSQFQYLGPEGGFASGDVIGPASSIDTSIVRFSGTTGKIIQDSGVLIDNSDNVTGVSSMNIDGATGNTLVVDTNVLAIDASNNRVGIGTSAPSTFFHLVGTDGQKFRGIAVGFTGSEDYTLQSSVQTTDDIPTNLISVSVAEGEMVTLFVRLGGFQSDFSDAISGSILAGSRRATGGDVTLIGTPVIDILESDSNTDVTVTVDTGTQALLIQVVGIAAQTWNWACTYNYQKVLTNA